MRKKVSIFLILTSILTSFAYGQNKSVKGLITDEKTGEALLGAYIIIKGTTKGSMTDIDGKYEIKGISDDKITLVCSFISYEPQELEVSFAGGNEKYVDFKLGSAQVKLAEVEVVAKSNRESEKALLLEQKKSITATLSIGAQELSRKGVSDAEGAVTKVSGISKQEGVKNVFVRGLGDRFNSTFLNGFPLPSEDPEYKNISLDFFSSDVIQTVYVNKVFTPSLDGDVGGANINIISKELKGDGEFAIGVSGGFNSQTYSKRFTTLDGVNVFGFANNTPGPSESNLSSYDFKNKLDPKNVSPRLDQEYSITGGKKFFNNKLSFYITGAYDVEYNYLTGLIRETNTGGMISQDQTYDEYEINTSHMLLTNLDYKLNKHNISYNGIYIHSNRQMYGDYFGLDNSHFQSTEEQIGLMRRQQVNDNSLIVNQLSSNWNLSSRWNLDAGVALNLVYGNEPDRRINYLSYENNVYLPIRSTGNQQRYFSTLNDNDFNVKLDATYKLSTEDDNNSLIRFGYSGRFASRSFEGIEYDHNVLSQQEFMVDGLILDSYFNKDNLAQNAFRLDRNIDKYSVNKYVNSGYAELTYQLGKKVTAMAGARFSKAFIKVDYNVDKGGSKGTTYIDKNYILPALNVKYDVNQNNSFRFGLSQTYTLPQDKEVSPFRYIGKNFRSQGNPNLQPATNYNADLKWDFYLSSGEIITLNAFYKYVKDPISRVEKASAGGFQTYDNISDYASVMGTELEIKKNIWNKGASLLSLGINASYIYTNLSLDTKVFTNSSSELEGSAPFIVNSDLSYILTKKKFTWTSAVVLNYFSDRVYSIGTNGFEDIIEEGIPTLDFVTGVKISNKWELGFKAKNLLNPEFVLSREPSISNSSSIILDQFKKGSNYSLGITFKF